MKKFFASMALAFLFNACDDGELTIENIDFSEVTASSCGNIVYKLKDTEALFFELENPSALFVNDATPVGSPRSVPVNAANRIFYRSYSGEITSDNLCGTIPPATPVVMEEWTFTGGNIEVTTTPVIIENPDFPGGELIQQYRHHIVFRNVTKNTPDGSEILDFDFGFFTTTPNALAFNFGDELNKCGNLITNTDGSEAITLDIDPALIENVDTPIGSPRIGLLGSTENKLVYSLFQSAVTDSYFCTLPTPSTPVSTEQWIGDPGVGSVSGIIEVTTTGSGPGVFVHEIRLKDAVLRRGNSSFSLADDYLLGLLTTN